MAGRSAVSPTRAPGKSTTGWSRLIAGAFLLGASLCGQVVVSQGTPTRDLRPVGNSDVRGVVVDAATGLAVRRAAVSIAGKAQQASAVVVTDDVGRFEFLKLPEGEYLLRASKPGYLDSVLGQVDPGSGRPGTPIVLRASRPVPTLTIRLAKTSAISGMVRDENGDLAIGADVIALRYGFQDSEWALLSEGRARTDDRGIYRVSGLRSGRYYISVSPVDPEVDVLRAELQARSESVGAKVTTTGEQSVSTMRALLSALGGSSRPLSRIEGYAPIFYPGTVFPQDAARLDLGSGEERTGVDVSLRLVPMTRISGTVVNAGLLPAGRLVLARTEPGPRDLRGTSLDSTGHFVFANVPPGEYEITLISGGPGRGVAPATATALKWARASLVINGQPDAEVFLDPRPALDVRGQLLLDGRLPGSNEAVTVTLTPVLAAVTTPIRATVDASGHFAAGNLLPARYLITTGDRSGRWFLRSTQVDGRESAEATVDLRPTERSASVVLQLTSQPTRLSGRLTTADGLPASNCTIIVFPVDESLWKTGSVRIQGVRPTTEGTFSFIGLPAGEYRLVGVTDVEPGEWFAPEFLRPLVGVSVRVPLAEGETRTQDLRIAR